MRILVLVAAALCLADASRVDCEQLCASGHDSSGCVFSRQLAAPASSVCYFCSGHNSTCGGDPGLINGNVVTFDAAFTSVEATPFLHVRRAHVLQRQPQSNVLVSFGLLDRTGRVHPITDAVALNTGSGETEFDASRPRDLISVRDVVGDSTAAAVVLETACVSAITGGSSCDVNVALQFTWMSDDDARSFRTRIQPTSAPPTQPVAARGQSLHVGAIIGIVVGVTLVGGISVALAVWKLRPPRIHYQRRPRINPGLDLSGVRYAFDGPSAGESEASLRPGSDTGGASNRYVASARGDASTLGSDDDGAAALSRPQSPVPPNGPAEKQAVHE